MHPTRLRVPLVLVATLGAACAPRESDPEAAPAGPNVVEVIATEYAFQLPDTIPAGPTTFRLIGRGAEPHHAVVVRLDEGKTLADVQAAMQAAMPGPRPPWAVPVGGPNTLEPGGGVAETTMDLAAGTYVVLCFIAAPDGTPHAAKGMVKTLTVVPSDMQRSLPEADVMITLSDYRFETVPPLTAGRHVIRVVTEPGQPHEVVLVRLADGETVQDFAAAVDAMERGELGGRLPGTMLGGVAPLAPGGANYFTVDLAPGEYGLLCFLGDAGDGRSHTAHGMMQQITVM